jgi:hypothetical protein
MRQVRSMASEFTRGMEDLATDSELGDLKNTIADVKSGNLTGIADKIDPVGELKESVAEIKSSADLDATSGELTGLKDVGDETSQQMASATKPAAGAAKSAKAKAAKKKS